MTGRRHALAATALVVALGSVVRAQSVPLGGAAPQTGVPASLMPIPLREIGFDQRLGERVPLDVALRDENGRPVWLGDFFGKRAVVLTFAYYECPMLCSQVLNSLASALAVLTLTPGSDFEIVTISFNPRDTPELARGRKAATLERYRKAGAENAWHFLIGDEKQIRRVTDATGFRYVWDNETKQYAHPSGILVLTPDGRLSHYLYGIEYGPRDLRLALVEASSGTIGNAVDAILHYCYRYDPATGRYGFAVMTLVRAAGIATVLAIASFILISLRRERNDAGRTFRSGTAGHS
jgi:protein SCO1/2